jgi:hypothetical protein
MKEIRINYFFNGSMFRTLNIIVFLIIFVILYNHQNIKWSILVVHYVKLKFPIWKCSFTRSVKIATSAGVVVSAMEDCVASFFTMA